MSENESNNVVPFPLRLVPPAPESKLVKDARYIAGKMPDMVGFIVIGVGKDGGYMSGWRIDEKVFGATLFGTLLIEAVRREIITQSEVVHVLNNNPVATHDDDDGA